VNFRTLDRILRALGFEPARRRGSHVFYRHPDGRTTTAPDHGRKDLARPLIRDILADINITPEQFEDIRRRI
jgi:predicted RNA binding protein YcfA (HicA-like mRNA interferase family)